MVFGGVLWVFWVILIGWLVREMELHHVSGSRIGITYIFASCTHLGGQKIYIICMICTCNHGYMHRSVFCHPLLKKNGVLERIWNSITTAEDLMVLWKSFLWLCLRICQSQNNSIWHNSQILQFWGNNNWTDMQGGKCMIMAQKSCLI